MLRDRKTLLSGKQVCQELEVLGGASTSRFFTQRSTSAWRNANPPAAVPEQRACVPPCVLPRRELEDMEDLSQRYRALVEQNRALYNEVQDLKGSIRVFCRIR